MRSETVDAPGWGKAARIAHIDQVRFLRDAVRERRVTQQLLEQLRDSEAERMRRVTASDDHYRRKAEEAAQARNHHEPAAADIDPEPARAP